MAPTRTKKGNPIESTASVDVQNFPVPPRMIPTKIRSPQRTPMHRSPIKKNKMGLTVTQKQALMDNLQLEITERARKLRAQYNLQAQGLRTRIEIRVNRIPTALRKANMGELLIKYSETAPKPPAHTAASREKLNSPYKNLIQSEQSQRTSTSKRVPKRTSDGMIAEDKENEDIENPRKRSRQQAAPNPPARTTSHKIPPAQVLSPRSANSRTLPRSPIRASPGKSFLARPVSPLKPTAPIPAGGAAGILTGMVEKAKATRSAPTSRKVTDTSAAGGAGRRKKAAPAAAAKANKGRGSGLSESSESSNTTVVRKTAVPVKKEPATKKTVMGTIRGMGAKKALPAAKAVPATATGGRVLRKRN